ncbi:hypothetical protein D7X74_07685 [Corallococcus sp. CA047B]|uniref:DNA sulfur modification protein DndB n=1 Tax=Corallococcus sp. CA047B TaxID=2316729 RepID=UPI000EA33993|nr:DNA sulfur modification protein DndB [Corallococcus sp. CA047B]RKH19162.1 hypothetical protein D7X74_07685 [Corallococcus sp. CA047B]
MKIGVLVSKQAGKTVMIGAMSAAEVIANLSSQAMTVNNEAQRSLARGAEKESTKDLLDSDTVHKMPRTREFREFLVRVLKHAIAGKNDQGFFGSIQFIVPERFKGARLRLSEVEPGQSLPTNLALALSSLGRHRQLGTFEAEPMLEEAVFHIADGQGRCFGFFSMRRWIQEEINNLKAELKKLEKNEASEQLIDSKEKQLKEMEALREQINVFLTETHIPFVAYISAVTTAGEIVGLGVEAEKRLYIESNALNSKASQEELVKYESNSPVVLALRMDRLEEENVWMSPDFIEEDSKTVGKNSTKVFTLSALVQAYSYSMTNDNDPISRGLDEQVFEMASKNHPFVSAYWKRVSDAFSKAWVPDVDQKQSERREYLQARRAEQNVLFQAVFLHALGRLGYALGLKTGWDANSPELNKLAKLTSMDFVAKKAATDAAGEATPTYNSAWQQAMMKPAKDGAWSFNNSSENVERVYELLCGTVGIPVVKAAKKAPVAAVPVEEVA